MSMYVHSFRTDIKNLPQPPLMLVLLALCLVVLVGFYINTYTQAFASPPNKNVVADHITSQKLPIVFAPRFEAPIPPAAAIAPEVFLPAASPEAVVALAPKTDVADIPPAFAAQPAATPLVEPKVLRRKPRKARRVQRLPNAQPPVVRKVGRAAVAPAANHPSFGLVGVPDTSGR